MNGMYRSKTAAKAARRNRLFVILGAILTVFFALSVVLALTDEDLGQNLAVYVVLLIPSVLLCCLGLRGRKLADRANRYSAIFACDQDGVVTLSELARQTGMEPSAILPELEQLLDKGYLCNCSLQTRGQPRVILSSGTAEEEGSGFVDVLCPACGGTTRLRAGSSGTCEYCGSPLVGK